MEEEEAVEEATATVWKSVFLARILFSLPGAIYHPSGGLPRDSAEEEEREVERLS